MKKIFMFFAAMLLMSVNAFAQSSETPLKGDVNEDGVVDVADITAVIGIIKNVQEHYFYLGTIKPTAENYKIIPGATTSFASLDEAVGTTVSVGAGQTLYMLCPAQWVKGKTVALEDNSGETISFLEEIDYTTVSGYAIYETQALSDAKDVTFKGNVSVTYYWYGGQVPPTDMDHEPEVEVIQPGVLYLPANHWYILEDSHIIAEKLIGNTTDFIWYFATPSVLKLQPRTNDLQTITSGIHREDYTILVNGIRYDVWWTSSSKSVEGGYSPYKTIIFAP